MSVVRLPTVGRGEADVAWPPGCFSPLQQQGAVHPGSTRVNGTALAAAACGCGRRAKKSAHAGKFPCMRVRLRDQAGRILAHGCGEAAPGAVNRFELDAPPRAREGTT
jgi:hypothetical protein